MNLARKALHGIAWVTLFNLIIRGVRFVITIILARLLEPKDFGLVAIGLLVINTVSMFRDLGMGQALIYQQKDIKKAANTAFMIFPFIGICLAFIAYILSPFAAEFFNEADSEPVIKVLSVTLFLVTLGITPSALLDKELEFKKQFVPEVVSILSYGIVGIILAFSGFGVWAIVYGKVISLAVWLVVLWIVSPFKPKFELDLQVAKGLFGYGRHILGATLIMFALANVDKGIIGRFLGTTALGYYTMAYTISNVHVLNITNMIHRVFFPLFSKIQEKEETIKRVYLKTIKYVSGLIAPMSFGLLVLAPDLITIFLGEKWLPSLRPLQILAFAGVFQTLNSTINTVLKALGKPDTVKRILFLQLIGFLICVYPLSKEYGISGISIAIAIPVIIYTFVGFNQVKKLMEISWMQFWDNLKTPFFCSVIMMGTVAFFQETLVISGIIRLIILILTGIISYTGSIVLLNRKLVSDFIQDISFFTKKPVSP